jgi:hypothetical protein
MTTATARWLAGGLLLLTVAALAGSASLRYRRTRMERRVRFRAGTAGLRRRRSVRGEPSAPETPSAGCSWRKAWGQRSAWPADLRQICGAIRRPADGRPLGGLGGGFLH